MARQTDDRTRSIAPTVLVVGVGYTGRRVLAGLTVGTAIGLSRSAVRSSHVSAILDLDTDTALPVTLPDRYSVIYTVPPAGSSLQDVRLERLLVLLTPPPGRFVYISTTGVYGNRDGALVSETTPTRPETDRSRRRVNAELHLRQWCGEHAVEPVILRAPGIYGPGRLGVERIRNAMPVLNEADANPGNRIHVDDLARCCIAALAADVPGGIFNVGDGDARSSTWFAREVASQCGLAAPPGISRDEASKQFSAERMSFLAESRRIDTRKMHDVLGVIPRYANAEDGIRASLAEETPTAGA